MTRDEFERLLLTHGGDRGRWPPGARAPAEELLAHDPVARTLLDEAERLDRAVAEAAIAPAAGAALASGIAAALDREAGARSGGERGFGLGHLAAWAGSVAAAALIAGFFFGQSATGFDFSQGMLAFVAGDLAEREATP